MNKYYVQENTVVVVDSNSNAYMIHVRGSNDMPVIDKLYDNYDESTIGRDFIELDPSVGEHLIAGIKHKLNDRIDTMYNIIEAAKSYKEDLEMLCP